MRTLMLLPVAVGTCSTGQYFDSLTFTCSACPASLSLYPWGCDCPVGSIRATTLPLRCSACPSGSAPSADLTTCLKCDSGTSSNGECTCADSLAVPYEYAMNGDGFTVSSAAGTSCITCSSSATFPGSSGNACSPCPALRTRSSSGSCLCSTGYVEVNGACLPSASVAIVNADTVVTNADDLVFAGVIQNEGQYSALIEALESVPVGAQVKARAYSEVDTFMSALIGTGSVTLTSSRVYSDFYVECGVNCVSGLNQTACQCLANLCVLSLYSSNSTACRLWDSSFSVFSAVAPVGFRSASPATGVALPLNILAATFAANGTLLGYSDVADSLQLCGVSGSASQWKSGAFVNGVCEIPVSMLEGQPLVFYELHALLNNGSRAAIPVTILNNKQSGSRFFLVDSVSAPNATYVRYASSFHIFRDSTDSIKIRVGYSTVMSGGQSAGAGFRAEVGEVAGSAWYKAAVGLLAAATVLGVLAGLWSVICTLRRLPSGIVGMRLFLPRWLIQIKAFFNAVFAAYFILLFCLSCYWAIGFRGHARGILPTTLDGGPDYTVSDGYVILLFVLGCLCVFGDSIQASRVFVYFLDNEEPEALAVQSPSSAQRLQADPTTFGVQIASQSPPQKQQVTRESGKVSVWRSLFIANEYCERLCATKTSPLYTWFILVAALNLGNWEYACRFFPIASSPLNPILQASIPVLIWLAIIIGTVVWKWLVAIWGGHDLHNFVDICSLANISLLIMDEPLHGWYVHGKAPSGKGDWSSSELVQKLHEEECDLLIRRGLMPNDPRTCDLQTFEILLPVTFPNDLHARFDEIVTTLNAIRMRGGRIEDADVSKLNQARKEIQTDVQATLDSVLTEGAFRPKTFLETIGVAQAVDLPGKGVLLEDWSGLGWAGGLLYGSQTFGFPTGTEFRLIALELLVFLLVFRYGESSILAGGVAFLVGEGLRLFRKRIGKRMVSYTSGIDSRFFL